MHAVTADLNNDVHQTARHHNDLTNRVIRNKAAHIFISHRYLCNNLSVGIGCHGYATTELAIDLHHDFQQLPCHCRLVGNRPVFVNRRCAMAQYLPQLMRYVRHDRRKQQDDGVERLSRD